MLCCRVCKLEDEIRCDWSWCGRVGDICDCIGKLFPITGLEGGGWVGCVSILGDRGVDLVQSLEVIIVIEWLMRALVVAGSFPIGCIVDNGRCRWLVGWRLTL